jgi:hypothetical protein
MTTLRTGRLERAADRAIVAVAEALFPPNSLGAPDFRETELPARLHRYMEEVPEGYRRLITLLFVFVEWCPPLVALYPRRFSRLSLASRQNLVRRWRASPVYPLRIIGDALKGLMSMMYLSHPTAMRYLGMYTVSGRDWDPLVVDHKPDALVSIGRSR